MSDQTENEKVIVAINVPSLAKAFWKATATDNALKILKDIAQAQSSLLIRQAASMKQVTLQGAIEQVKSETLSIVKEAKPKNAPITQEQKNALDRFYNSQTIYFQYD